MEVVKYSEKLKFNVNEAGEITEIGFFDNYINEVPEGLEIGFYNFRDYQFIDGQLILKEQE
jgi:hypothetical protein